MTATRSFALEATREYLQSVVFVDDEIYVNNLAPAEAIKVDVVDARAGMQIFAKPVVPKVDEVVDVSAIDNGASQLESAEANERFHPKHLVESFARERMVCALYEPEKGFPTGKNSELFKLCERADVVILDWEFHKEPKKILPLISGLVSAAQTTVPHHVRLCTVYTATPDLKKVASQIYDDLKQKGLVVEPDGDYSLNAGSSRVIVLGKPSTGRPRDQIEEAQVSETNLAQRIIEEFASMHEGILPSMALHGLASVRTNTKKILEKFRGDMDGAFLAHRGLISPGDDAFEQIPELLAEEVLAVMMDSQISPGNAKSLAEEVIDSFGLQTIWRVDGEANPAIGLLAIKLLKGGTEKVLQKLLGLDGKALKSLHTYLDNKGISAKERLAALYASRTQYGNSRSLCFGTIVRFVSEGAPAEYAICLMPLCDSVRLTKDKEYQFPFWRLRLDNQTAPSKGIVIELPRNEGYVELFSMGKSRDQLWLDSFKASAAKMVIAQRDGEAFVFKGTTKSVEWVAQLKPAHAQRIAQEIGASFARVGVLEAEWLRLKAERGVI